MAGTITIEPLHCQMCGHGADPERPWIPKHLGTKPRRCANPECRSMRWDAARYPHAGPPRPPMKLRGRKPSRSDKRGVSGITLNPRPQLRLPLSVAAAILIISILFSFLPSPASASNARCVVVGVPGASPQDANNLTPAKAVLRRVLHRRPVPFMPHAHVPEYLLCFIVETLECGHTVDVYPPDDPLIAVRRRCHACDSGKVVEIDAPKKPAVSVSIEREERKRA